MRFNGKELAAVALQPSHKFDKEGILLIKEKQDGLFRRGEVYTGRWCRLRGNMLFYLKNTDQCSEPAGVIVLERCHVQLDSPDPEGLYTFSLVFDGDKNAQQLATTLESERDSWIQALHMASYEYMRSQLKALESKLSLLQKKETGTGNPKKPFKSKNLLDPSEEPFLEMCLACDNLMCDGDGTPPNPMMTVSIITPPENQWVLYAQTEVLERISNPCFLTTVGFRNSDNIGSATRVKLSTYDVRERLTSTMTLLGTAIFTISQLLEAGRDKLRVTLLSVDSTTVGFVTITAWPLQTDVIFKPELSISKMEPALSDEQIPERARTQSLPVRLNYKLRSTQHSNLNIIYENAFSQTYRFHTGLGADLSVHEIMAENKLNFLIPQSLLILFIKEEKELLHNISSLGELKPEWSTRQMEEIEQHLEIINTYTQALTSLDSYRGPSFKPSAQKGDQNMEFVPVNLHLQRIWIQNESTKKNGYHDVITVGAFTAYSMKYKNGGLLKLLSLNKNSNPNNKVHQDTNDKLTQAAGAAMKIKQLRHDIREALERLNKLAKQRSVGDIQVVMADIANMAHQLTKVCEPTLIEEACRMLEEIRVPQNNEESTNEERDIAKMSPAKMISIHKSPGRTALSEPNSIEKDDEFINALSLEEKTDSSKEWPMKHMQHRRSASDARLYTETTTDLKEADRHSLLNVRIFEEGNNKKDGTCGKHVSSPSVSRRLTWRFQKQLSLKEEHRSASRTSLSFIENSSVMNLLRKAGSKNKQDKSVVSLNCQDSDIIDSNRTEDSDTLKKCKKNSSVQSLTRIRRRSRSPDEPEPWPQPVECRVPSTLPKDVAFVLKDLTQLNIEASVMCMASKVKSLCQRSQNAGSGTGVGMGSDQPSSSTGQATPPQAEVDWIEELRPSTKKLRQALDCLLKTSRLTHGLFVLQRSTAAAAQMCQIRYRRDVVFSQALTAVIAGITTRLYCLKQEQSFFSHLNQIGLLAVFEGLLSCHGDEMGMLEDMVVAIDDLQHVNFKLTQGCVNGSTPIPRLEGSRMSMTVIIPVPDHIWSLITKGCQGLCVFHITPVFFNVGINEQASFAERFGDLSLQEKINVDGAEKLYEFYMKCKKSEDVEKGQRNFIEPTPVNYYKLLNELTTEVRSRKGKNVVILHLAEQLCRHLGGLRFTSCKSAKDRTSMAVTLEQGMILNEIYDLAEPEFYHSLECMRCEGSRRENTYKNTGVRKYAFNSLQIMALPKQYRPPPGTYGNVQT